jgi:hypothetical protein
MSFKVFDKHYKTIIEYKAMIVPIKNGDKFLPNISKFESVRFNMLTEDFEKYQKQGKTIIVNMNGGWCFLDEGCEIVAEGKHFEMNQN